MLLFNTAPHHQWKPLAAVYDGYRNFLRMIKENVPASTSIIWYNAPPKYVTLCKNCTMAEQWRLDACYKCFTFEGPGFSPNEKVTAENHFVSTLQNQHRKSGNTPPVYSFFDLYNMASQTNEKLAQDAVHSFAPWYRYVIGYTATMLPSFPAV